MKAAGLLLMFLAIYGCTAKPYAVEPDVWADSARTINLYIVSHGWHVGLAIAAEELNSVIPELEERFVEAQYYELGWGDKDFYQARENTLGLALQALFWSRGAVVHVAALSVSPFAHFPANSVVHTCLKAEEANSLKQYLYQSFTSNSAGNLVELDRGLYGDSHFYEGEGRYHLLNTSNKWTAKALKSAGMDLSPTLRLTAGSVTEFVKANRNDCTL